MMKELSWEPQAGPNGTYCSPACGHGCSILEHKRATLEGETLAESLGEGWKSEVWEDMGWQHRAISADGHTKVYHSDDGSSYTAYIGSSDHGDTWYADGLSPQSAVDSARSWALSDVGSYASMIGMTLHPVPQQIRCQPDLLRHNF